ncbi:MAG: flagellar basal body rod protein FlgB [candidate division Zixibacteria bacterium]|nr:flagellar basal body rod protein FlgB [candidate division Zixibacteria bacterium]
MIIKDQILNKSGVPLFKNLLRVVSSSQKLTAANVANVSLPGYQSKSIDFKQEMAKAVRKQKITLNVTNERHIPPPGRMRSIKVIKNIDDTNESGVNNVDIDKEMARLAENQILYTYGTKALAKKFYTLKTVIRGRS